MIPQSNSVRGSAAVALFLALAISLTAKAPLNEFHTRRSALRQSLDGGVLLLKGRVEAYDQVFRFEQEPNSGNSAHTKREFLTQSPQR